MVVMMAVGGGFLGLDYMAFALCLGFIAYTLS